MCRYVKYENQNLCSVRGTQNQQTLNLSTDEIIFGIRLVCCLGTSQLLSTQK